MRLRRVAVEGFRNLAPSSLSFERDFIVFEGSNAQGKTNTLEAIHYLATLKPLRGRRVRELIGWDEATASLSAQIQHDGIDRAYRVDLASSGRTLSIDGNKTHDLAAYFEGVRAIGFTPADGSILRGEPKRRRNWLDRAVFTAHPAHLGRVRQLKRMLAQKSAMLRAPKPDEMWLDSLDERLASLSADVVYARGAWLSTLLPHAITVHRAIASGDEQIAIEHKTRGVASDREAGTQAWLERFSTVRSREIERKMVLEGPQLDDVRVSIDGRWSRDFASRGQVRTLVLAMKLAEMMAAKERGWVPLFLIDDVSSELDWNRTERLVEVLRSLDAQVFMTTTEARSLRDILDPTQTDVVSVSGGILSR